MVENTGSASWKPFTAEGNQAMKEALPDVNWDDVVYVVVVHKRGAKQKLVAHYRNDAREVEFDNPGHPEKGNPRRVTTIESIEGNPCEWITINGDRIRICY